LPKPLPLKPCALCGQLFKPTSRHRKYCRPRCYWDSIKPWDGSRLIRSRDRNYWTILRRGHPRGGSTGRVLEHILIAEKAIGRYLFEPHQVHHVNYIGTDNRNSNLVICEDEQYHNLIHRRQRILEAGGDPDTDLICMKCRNVLPSTEFHNNRSRVTGKDYICKRCACTGTRRYLTLEELEHIHACHSEGESNTSIARRLGIDQGTVSRLINGKLPRYKHMMLTKAESVAGLGRASA
jgi:hypothetical protein